MALKDLIATPGETAAHRVLKNWRIAGDARDELAAAIKREVERAVATEREACAKLADRHAEDAEHLTQAENTAILIAADIRARR